MRDIVITAFIFGMLPWVLQKPHIGILMWSWLGYMNPHRMAWGFAFSMPFSQLIAVTTLFSLFISKEPKRLPINGLTVLWLLFILWMGFTTIFAFYPEDALGQYNKVIKIQFVTFLMLLIMGSKERIRMMVWVIVFSIGFFGVKGGIFSIITLGAHRVYGPSFSFIRDNNALALALLMTMPLAYYLWSTTKEVWIRRALLASMLFMSVSIVSSYSRGAYLGGAALATFFWLKSPHKLSIGIVLLILITGLLAFMPAQWHERMGTIANYQEDASAMGRIDAWNMTINLSAHRLTGGGFECWTQDVFNVYGYGKKRRAAHSIYFSVLGEHGLIGLGFFLIIGLMSLRTSNWIIRHCRGHPDLRWVSELARMIQLSLIVYATGGAFLSLAYFDLYWHLVAILVLSKILVQQHLAQAKQPQPAAPASALPGAATPGTLPQSMRRLP